MGCRDDASIHDGTVKASLVRVRDGLNKTGRPILYYIDAGAGNCMLRSKTYAAIANHATGVLSTSLLLVVLIVIVNRQPDQRS